MNELEQIQQRGSAAQQAFEKRVAEIRKLMKPTHVKLHHIPRWMKRLLAAALRQHGHARYYQGEMINALHRMGFDAPREGRRYSTQFMDHWGSIERGTIFVSEPYPYPGMCGDVEHFAELIGCDAIVGAISEWFPPYTVRLEFREREQSAEIPAAITGGPNGKPGQG